MDIKCCDRCGRVTKEGPAFIVPSKDKNGSGSYYEGVCFGEPVILCKFCLEDFERFKYEHENFNNMYRLANDDDYVRKDEW